MLEDALWSTVVSFCHTGREKHVWCETRDYYWSTGYLVPWGRYEDFCSIERVTTRNMEGMQDTKEKYGNIMYETIEL